MFTKSPVNKKRPAEKLAKTDIPAARPGEKVGKLIERMVSEEITRVHLIDNASFRGFVTDRDVLDILGAGPKSKGVRTLNVHASRAASSADAELKQNDTMEKAIELFRKWDSEALPVRRGKRFLGIISRKDLVNRIKEPTRIKVGDVMSDRVFSVSEDWSVFDTARVLCNGAFRRAPVTSKGILMGVITPYDIVSHLSKTGKLGSLKRHKTGLSEVMNRDVVTVRPESDLADAVELMRSRNISFLPVTEDRELVGVLTDADVLEIFR